MKLFLDDIKKIDWLRQEIEAASWGKTFLSLQNGFYFTFNYDLVEKDSSIKIVSSKNLYEINEGIYRGLMAEHIGYMKSPFDTTSYLFFSLLKNACRTEESINKLNDLFFSFKVKDFEESKKNLKVRISGSQQVNSAISFNTALNNIFSSNNNPVNGLCMIYDLIDNYAKNVKGRSIYQMLTKIVKAVKNPNGGLVPEYANTSMRYLIVGEKAASTNAEMMASLERAKELYRSYNNPYDIYAETGWFFNKYDFKWRKRISDDSFYFDLDKISRNNGSYQFPNDDKYNKQIQELANGGSISKLIASGYNTRLSDYVNFEEAYKLYPSLKDVFSVFSVNVIDYGYAFYFSPSEKSLVLISSKKTQDYNIERIKYIALHEIQHFVQHQEGFGNGGNETFAKLIDAVGGSAFRNFYNALQSFQNKFSDVCIELQKESFDYFLSKLDVPELNRLCETKESIVSNSNTIAYYLIIIYSLDEKFKSIITDFINKYLDKSYLEIFELSLRQNKAALERNQILTKKGWTERDLYMLNFQTYQALMGEVESRYVQQTAKIPKDLKDYFELYTSESIDPSKISVYNNSGYIDEGKKAEAGIETTLEGNYVIHLPEAFSNSINLLHETGHILFDFVKEEIFSNSDFVEKAVLLGKDVEEYFCESFVDYIHRKNIDVQLTKDLNFDRGIENYTDFDDLISSVLYYQNKVDEGGLALRLEFVNKVLETIPNVEDRKQKQLEIINRENPAPNEDNTWVRSVKDILSPEEAFKDDDNFIGTPDFTIEDAKKALKDGEVVVYSSYPIKDGVFVTPSKMEATLYAGNKEPYSKKVKINDVAWIDSNQGQYAEVKPTKQQKETIPNVEDWSKKSN